jgi:hypothetical protein
LASEVQQDNYVGQNGLASVNNALPGTQSIPSSRNESEELANSQTAPTIVKREPSLALIEVKIKVKDGEEQLKHVSFTKSEDGTLMALTSVPRSNWKICPTTVSLGSKLEM